MTRLNSSFIILHLLKLIVQAQAEHLVGAVVHVRALDVGQAVIVVAVLLVLAVVGPEVGDIHVQLLVQEVRTL